MLEEDKNMEYFSSSDEAEENLEKLEEDKEKFTNTLIYTHPLPSTATSIESLIICQQGTP